MDDPFHNGIWNQVVKAKTMLFCHIIQKGALWAEDKKVAFEYSQKEWNYLDSKELTDAYAIKIRAIRNVRYAILCVAVEINNIVCGWR